MDHRVTTTGHGRRATRTIKVIQAPDWVTFTGATQIAQVRRTLTQDGKRTVEVVYPITSADHTAAPPATLAAWVQGHWGIENRLHRVRDVTYDEDRSQIRTGNAPTRHGHSAQHRHQPPAHRGLGQHRRRPTTSHQSPREPHQTAPDPLKRDLAGALVVELTTRFKGTKDFVRALSVFSREAPALGYAGDFVNVEWFPPGSYRIEQGETATMMHFLLSGHVEIRREGEDGRVRVVDRSGPGKFIGEEGIATGQARNAHVVAMDDVTSLTFLASEPVSFDGRGEHARLLRTRSLPSGDQIDARVSTCIDVSDFVGHKIRATAAHRSQYPIDPKMFPESILREMFGVEYFIRVLPERELHTSLLDE